MALEPSMLHQLRIKLMRYCLSLTGSLWDAEDLAHDTCLKAMPVLQGKKEHAHPEAYLIRIAKTTWIDKMRMKGASESLLEEVEIQSLKSSMDTESTELQAALQVLIDQLSPLQRTVLLLRDVMGYRTDQTAHALDTTEGAVKAALSRARSSLRELQLSEEELADSTDQDTIMLIRAYADAIREGDAQWIVQLMYSGGLTTTMAVGMVMNSMLSNNSIESKECLNRFSPSMCLAA